MALSTNDKSNNDNVNHESEKYVKNTISRTGFRTNHPDHEYQLQLSRADQNKGAPEAVQMMALIVSAF